jgi:hypothetical protein
MQYAKTYYKYVTVMFIYVYVIPLLFFLSYINGTQIPYANTAKYVGMTLDTKLRWKEHNKKKHDELNTKFRKMYWLLERNSELSIYNKLILYKQVLRPVWSYVSSFGGCASDSNIQVIQRFQNKVLKCIVQAPWYIRNSDFIGT